jgi:GrpB-like predicted nucleotidyltransferase (UPF0157 family)
MIRIAEPDEHWAGEFNAIAADLHDATGGSARRIDHIGSTSVPGLAAKDVIDIQVTVSDEQALEDVASALGDRGWRRDPAIVRDHQVPGLPTDPSEWPKVFFDEPDGSRPIHIHVRIDGRANQRYALLFRDYLRDHPVAAAAYEEVKRGLATLAPDSGSYADAKDPACDLVYLAAEVWAREEDWTA